MTPTETIRDVHLATVSERFDDAAELDAVERVCADAVEATCLDERPLLDFNEFHEVRL